MSVSMRVGAEHHIEIGPAECAHPVLVTTTTPGFGATAA
jgi:hypothetical protein